MQNPGSDDTLAVTIAISNEYEQVVSQPSTLKQITMDNPYVLSEMLFVNGTYTPIDHNDSITLTATEINKKESVTLTAPILNPGAQSWQSTNNPNCLKYANTSYTIKAQLFNSGVYKGSATPQSMPTGGAKGIWRKLLNCLAYSWKRITFRY